MEGERRRLIHPILSHRLQVFAGTEFAQAAMSRTLPPEFSRAAVVASLSHLRRQLPPSPLNDRMLGEPEFLRKTPQSSRAQEWDLSRGVLLEALDGLTLNSALRFSLSHSSGAALAIAVFEAKTGLGVDLESADRVISDAAFSRFFRPEEGAFLDDRLDHWVLKEACFKAHPRSGETIIADYQIISGREIAGEMEYGLQCTKGAPEYFRARVGTVDEYRYAFALNG